MGRFSSVCLVGRMHQNYIIINVNLTIKLEEYSPKRIVNVNCVIVETKILSSIKVISARNVFQLTFMKGGRKIFIIFDMKNLTLLIFQYNRNITFEFEVTNETWMR